MSWFSKWWRGSGQKAVLTQLATALIDGQVTKQELNGVLFKVGLGVVNEGLPGQLQKAFDLTDPVKLAQIGGKTLNEVLAEVNKAHVLLGQLLEEVK